MGAFKGRNILFVDNKIVDQTHLGQIFSPYYRCYFANSGKTVLELYRKKKPAMVVCDIDLSDISGTQFCQQLKCIEQEVCLVILSACNNKATRIQALKAGANAFIDKSLDEDEIFLRVNNLHPYGIPFHKTETQEDNTVTKQLQDAFSQYYFSSRPKEKKITVTSVAKELALSNRSLQRKLKQETGLTFSEHHCHYRLEKSQQLLQQGYHPSEIDHMLCFSSPSHFSCCFKKKYCMTPSHYIANLSSKNYSLA
jgi:YesN/AraC family two-component response regulator